MKYPEETGEGLPPMKRQQNPQDAAVKPEKAKPAREASILPSLNLVPSYKRVADLIEREILEGRLEPGVLLPTEGELSSQLNVHRSTIREGIRSLENSGLIKRVGAKRLMVTIPDAASVAVYNSRAMGLHRVSFFELWEMQMELEPFCAALSAGRISDELAREIAANVDRLEEILDDDKAVAENDIEFHHLIVKATGNKALMLSLEHVGVLLFSATKDLYQKVPPARHRLLQAHKTIAAAVISHDAETARAWMAKHIRDFRRGYLIAGLDLDKPLDIDSDALMRLER